MEGIGLLIVVINVAIAVIIGILRKLDDQLLAAERVIKDELMAAYRKFGFSVSGSTFTSEFESSAERLRKLHYSSVIDISRVGFIGRFLSVVLPIIILTAILAAISLVSAVLAFGPTESIKRLVFLVGIPTVMLVVELLILFSIIAFERYLKRLQDRYKNVEY